MFKAKVFAMVFVLFLYIFFVIVCLLVLWFTAYYSVGVNKWIQFESDIAFVNLNNKMLTMAIHIENRYEGSDIAEKLIAMIEYYEVIKFGRGWSIQ